MIRFHNVSVSFFGEKKALDGVNLHIKPRDFVFITGESGAGKSTLLRLIYADLVPTRGVVLVGGRNVTIMKKRQIPYLRRNIGVVFQDFKLLENRSVYENIKLALDIFYLGKKQTEARIFPLLKKLGIFARRDTIVSKLSGGEKQRVAIARALINEPDVILADEPTGNLDEDNARNIMELLIQARDDGATVLVATHDLHLMHDFPFKTVNLSRGRLKLLGNKEEHEEEEEA